MASAINSLCLALIAPSAIEARASCPKPAMASDWDLRNGPRLSLIS